MARTWSSAAAAVVAVVSACGGGGGRTKTRTVAARAAGSAPAEPALTIKLTFAEMVVTDGPDAVLRIHEDGTTEIAERPRTGAGSKIDWREGPAVRPDGTFVFEGTEVARIKADGRVVNLVSGELMPVVVEESSVVVGEGATQLTLTAAEDGTLSVTGAPGNAQTIRVEGAPDRESLHTAVAIAAVVFLSGRSGDGQTLSGPAPQR